MRYILIIINCKFYLDRYMYIYNKQQQQNKILSKIRNISHYISFPLQIAYKLIEAGRSKDLAKLVITKPALQAHFFKKSPTGDL